MMMLASTSPHSPNEPARSKKPPAGKLCPQPANLRVRRAFGDPYDRFTSRTVGFVSGSMIFICSMIEPGQPWVHWKKVDLVFGRPAVISGAVHRYGLPRTLEDEAAQLQ